MIRPPDFLKLRSDVKKDADAAVCAHIWQLYLSDRNGSYLNLILFYFPLLLLLLVLLLFNDLVINNGLYSLYEFFVSLAKKRSRVENRVQCRDGCLGVDVEERARAHK